METAEDNRPRGGRVFMCEMWTFCGSGRTSSLDVIGDRSSCLKTLTRAFLDIVQNTGGPILDTATPHFHESNDLKCTICYCVFYQPVTLPCGHSFCRKCIIRESNRLCKKCGSKLPSRLETNVLIKTLVEKWWPNEVYAARLCDEANQLLQDNPESALEKFDAAIVAAPDNANLLCSRSQALYQLDRLQESLTDADNAIRLRPHWSKGYYRKALVLSALSHYEEALIAFGICIALDKNIQLVKPEVTRLLQRLFHPSSIGKGLRCSFSYLYNTSDCEENSSGEDDFLQNLKQPSLSSLPIRILLERIFHEVEKIKRTEMKSLPLTLDSHRVEPSDFDCILCCRTLWRPVTTPCGHTYCSMCLDRCLDYSSACPLCMTSLADYLVINQKQVTEFVETALIRALPGVYAARMLLHRQEVIALETAPDIPVFVCTTAFPTIPCPLFVFEPRYRLMVRRCVEGGTRQFAMAACVNQPAGLKRYAEFGTMLEIKDWVLLGDGCSILSTVGVRRFQVISRAERDGYDTAQVQFLKDTPISSDNLQEVCELHDWVLKKGQKWFNDLSLPLRTEILRTFGDMPPPEPDWTTLNDGPSWTWWLLAILPLGPQLQVSILRTTCLAKRLRVISKTLDHIGQYQQYPGLPRHSTIKRGDVPVGHERST
ncbi:LON peptidase N-terminal domain and RING finger protein 1 [Lycorma delicatula]|uniref:LON peptidase N-terminal domain and RING finger protein 1 n=1 Tax=Lycorma delicatula TaxID=130591 RepID=UPI003F513AF8